MLETDLQKKCIAYLKSHKIYYLNIHGGAWGSTGTPDLIVCIKGRFVAFELKMGDATLRPDQKMHRNRIIKNQGLHYVPRTLVQFTEIVDSLLQERN